jgi:integrase
VSKGFTELSVKALPPGKHFDASTPAFGMRVGKHRRTWIVQRGADRRIIRLGHYPALSLQDARKAAKTLLASSLPTSKRVTFEQAYETFKAEYLPHRKERTQKDYRRIIELYFLPVLKAKRMDSVTDHTVSEITDALADRPSEQAHALAVARLFFRWAMRPPRRYLPANPLEGVQIAKSKRRKRTLTDEELKTLWHATGELEGTFPQIVRLLILMGQRRGETAALKEAYYSDNQQTITLPGEVTKNGQQHTFPVGPMAAGILAKARRQERTTDYLFQAVGSDKPFSGWSKCKRELDKVAKIAPWTLHDLRRTFRTNLGRLKVRPDIAERLVNHISARTDMEETYDLYTYLPEMREAMERWEAFLQPIIAGKIEASRLAA